MGIYYFSGFIPNGHIKVSNPVRRNIITEGLLQRALRRVQERADTYGDDGHYTSSLAIILPEITSGNSPERHILDQRYSPSMLEKYDGLEEILTSTNTIHQINGVDMAGYRTKEIAMGVAVRLYRDLLAELLAKGHKDFSVQEILYTSGPKDVPPDHPFVDRNSIKHVKLNGYALFYKGTWVSSLVLFPESRAEELGWFSMPDDDDDDVQPDDIM